MTKFMTLFLSAFTSVFVLGVAPALAQQSPSYQVAPPAAPQMIRSHGPTMYVVMFHADWCSPCKVVEPNLDRALKSLNDPSIKLVMIDVTDAPKIERSAHVAFDHMIAKQYNQWYGVTGFAAMIDADTKNTLGCVDIRYDVGSMTAHIRNLKTYAMANQPSFDVTCPAPNKAR